MAWLQAPMTRRYFISKWVFAKQVSSGLGTGLNTHSTLLRLLLLLLPYLGYKAITMKDFDELGSWGEVEDNSVCRWE